MKNANESTLQNLNGKPDAQFIALRMHSHVPRNVWNNPYLDSGIAVNVNFISLPMTVIYIEVEHAEKQPHTESWKSDKGLTRNTNFNMAQTHFHLTTTNNCTAIRMRSMKKSVPFICIFSAYQTHSDWDTKYHTVRMIAIWLRILRWTREAI